jgi:predicted TIM-barrel fold metal-dependent hydrolase
MPPISRRTFFASCAAAALARSAEPPLRIIDTHTHFYDPSRPQGVPWPKAGDEILYRTVLPPEYRAMAEPHGIAGTVVVEASPWLEDNQWLLDLAEKEPFIVGIVGNLDPLDSEFAANLGRFAKNPLFRGIRVSGNTLIARGNDGGFLASMRRLADAGLSLDLNGGPFLPHVAKLARAVPDLRIVIDHVGGAGHPDKPPREWAIAEAAAAPNVFCKVSGMPEQTGFPKREAPAEPAFYRPILDAVWNAFGAERLLFGSNWPVADNGTAFAGVMGIVREYFAEKSADARTLFFRENSRRVYRWIDR